MILPVIISPDHRLVTPSKEIEEISEETDDLLDDLFDTMTAHDGIGISACQVGKMVRLCVVQISPEDDVLEMINPVLVKKSGSTIDIEGCLSLPFVYGTVKRAKKITVEYFDREGLPMTLSCQGYLARCIQHELDHLDGQLFTEKIIEHIPENKVEQWMEENSDE